MQQRDSNSILSFWLYPASLIYSKILLGGRSKQMDIAN